MNLSDVYSQQVKKTPVIGASFGMHGGVHTQKDPIINKLEQDVFAKMQELDKMDHPNQVPTKTPSTGIQNFSVEDAIRELAMLQNK